ncbi:hypothetical protein [Streptomyces sp. NPDC002553]|uniref:hypothetical protein n=1 Tax=unclassified Streptomyces TaxID=2593676 RepID=UPI00332FD0D2
MADPRRSAVEYVLPWNTSPTGLYERAGCRTVRDKQDSHRRVRCDRLAPLTFRVDKAFISRVR